ncbi:hypothetical protein [Limimaricola sp.]|uniref:hypothetical protein n=1 Tax=Limimaricola sp. TaxID=2211665 RepID=UPI0040595612
MQDLMHSKFKTAEVAAALEHGNFTVFRRNYNSDRMALLAPFADAGRGEYAYPHVAEMSLHLAVAATHPREKAHMVTWGILDYLHTQVINSRKYHSKLNEIRENLGELKPDFSGPRTLDMLVVAPEVFFSEELISRDPDNRTWAIYSTFGAANGIRADVSLVREEDDTPFTLRDIRKKALAIATAGASDAISRYHFSEAAHRPYLLDLTGVFTRFEAILRRHIDARTGEHLRNR